jgi:protein AroM
VIRPRVGAVTIGQAPRPDLVEPLRQRLGGGAEILEAGALDGWAPGEGPSVGDGRPGRTPTEPDYPLTTRLRDGSRVTLDERDLAALVQQAIDRIEDAGADLTLLLCAGGFLETAGRRPLIRPFDAAAAELRGRAAARLGVIVPDPGQARAARRKWEAAGFQVEPLVGEPGAVPLPAAGAALDALVLDYVGHPSRAVEDLRQRTLLPVIDLAEAGVDAVVATIADLRADRRSPAGASR